MAVCCFVLGSLRGSCSGVHCERSLSLDQGRPTLEVPEGCSVSTQPSLYNQCADNAGSTICAIQEQVGEQNRTRGRGILS